MLSQYSWGDLIKVVLVVLVIYYTYVLLVYYRQDIREWISNRGQKPVTEPGDAQAEEEEDNSSLYDVNHYAKKATVTEPAPLPSADPAPVTPSAVLDQPLPPIQVVATEQAQEPDLNGFALDPDEEPEFSMPVLADVERPTERSVAQLISAAQRLQANEEGVLFPDDPADEVAANLADVINQQQGHRAFPGISFNR